MTVRELSKLYYINKLIDRQKEILDEREQIVAELEARLQPGGMDMSGMPHNPTPRNLLEEVVPQLIEAKERRKREKEKYDAVLSEFESERDRMENYLRSVNDERIRLILTYRFVDLLTWFQISQKIGGNNTEDSIKKMCYRYLKNSEKAVKSREE